MKSSQILLYFLIVLGCTILIANAFGRDSASVVTDLLYVTISGTLLIFSVIAVIKNRGDSDQGKAYLLFTGFVASWFGAEFIWVVSELVFHLSPFPQEAEWLYLGGYIFLFFFSIFYLKPFAAGISKKMYSYALTGTLAFLVPTLSFTYSSHIHANILQIIWAALYPIADAIVLFPTILGMVLFFKGKVGLLWSLAFIAIALNIVADSGILFLDVDRTYYTGNPIDILYLSAYVLFAFGINSHLKIFKLPKKKSFGNLGDLK